jgi:predicted amidohydrolase
MEVACVQAAFASGASKAERIDHMLLLLDRARGADLLVLPELWHVGYFNFDRYAEAAEPIHGPTISAVAEAARELGAFVHAGSIVERGEEGELYNTSFLMTPQGRVAHAYRKVHLFGYESEEPRLLTSGVQVRPATTDLGVVAMTTCYDLRFPELYRLLTDAELALVTSAWPTPRERHWQLLTRARALDNLFYLVACNVAGECNGVALAGRSVVVDPLGDVVAEAGADEEVLRAEIDLSRVAKIRAEYPFLDDRRIEIGRERR